MAFKMAFKNMAFTIVVLIKWTTGETDCSVQGVAFSMP
jgi:hypothetical protein